ncbi:MAG: FAD-binding protein [Nitrospira sp.]|nr:FAD-binding protein [Nitrospira sp.]
MTTQSPPTVLILGAGLTGLTAAYFLGQQGYRVTLLDHPSWQDGYRTDSADAAPMLFGCHRKTQDLLRALEQSETVRPDAMIPLEFRLPDGRIETYRSTHLPGALQWMTSLFGFHGLAWHDRWTLFSHLEQIWEQAASLPADLNNRLADEWLTSIGQSQEAREHIWSPLTQWLTGNALGRLSAAVFVRQLSTVFLGRTKDARLTCLHGSVGDRFIAPMRRAMAKHGATILPQTQIPDLRFGQNGISGIRLSDGSQLHAQWYIAALPHLKVPALLPERLLTRYAYFAQLGELQTLPEIAVQFSGRATMSHPRLLLLAGRPFHQLTITSHGPHTLRYRLSVISHPPLMELGDAELTALGRTELRTLLPDIDHDTLSFEGISRHDQAALSLNPGAALLRPIQQSPVKNLVIAGAWTDTGWPANIESAINSAARCAETVAGRPI